MAYGEITEDDVLAKLSFLEGNQSVPASGIDDWKSFVQSSLEEAWIRFPWDFARVTDTLTINNGSSPLPDDIAPGTRLDVRQVVSGSGDDQIYTEIPYGEQDEYSQGSYRYWITGASPDLAINTKETPGTLTIQYTSLAPVLSDGDTAPFPDPMIIALGARRYVRASENPQADISQEEQVFQARLEELWSQYNRNKPRRARRFYPGVRTGQVGGD